ncbi:MAG: XdhC family protein [Rhodospirillales bacterium]|nr:MAG: XdhC family protein [Rhodospirillales bacterium]
MKNAVLDALLAARAAKASAALVTELGSGAQTLVGPGAPPGDLPLGAALHSFVDSALADDRSMSAEIGDQRYFIHVFNPPRRLVIVGAVHIAQVLAPMAALAGYAVTVVDPRGAFATEDRFPGVELTRQWPDDALEGLDVDQRTAIVTLTHDPKLDDPALETALRRAPFYIGALGSKRTHASRVARLRETGFDDAEIARIHAPVGLDIGAVSPAEIALSILGEMTLLLHRKPPRAPA